MAHGRLSIGRLSMGRHRWGGWRPFARRRCSSPPALQRPRRKLLRQPNSTPSKPRSPATSPCSRATRSKGASRALRGKRRHSSYLAREWQAAGVDSGTNDPAEPWFATVDLALATPTGSRVQFVRAGRALPFDQADAAVFTPGERTLIERGGDAVRRQAGRYSRPRGTGRARRRHGGRSRRQRGTARSFAGEGGGGRAGA